jgi:hypothetical protein
LDDKRAQLRRSGLENVQLPAVSVKKREERLVWLAYDAGAAWWPPSP